MKPKKPNSRRDRKAPGTRAYGGSGPDELISGRSPMPMEETGTFTHWRPNGTFVSMVTPSPIPRPSLNLTEHEFRQWLVMCNALNATKDIALTCAIAMAYRSQDEIKAIIAERLKLAEKS